MKDRVNTKVISILLILMICLFSACQEELKFDPTNEAQLLEIYVGLHIMGNEKKQEIIEKYELNDETNIFLYKKAIEELSTDSDKWENFLNKAKSYL